MTERLKSVVLIEESQRQSEKTCVCWEFWLRYVMCVITMYSLIFFYHWYIVIVLVSFVGFEVVYEFITCWVFSVGGDFFWVICWDFVDVGYCCLELWIGYELWGSVFVDDFMIWVCGFVFEFVKGGNFLFLFFLIFFSSCWFEAQFGVWTWNLHLFILLLKFD